MSRIEKAFRGRKAFIPFITCGAFGMEETEKIVIELANSGADIIELGIPFSDPTAEGPVIMEADLKALRNGTSTEDVLELTKRLRSKLDIPIIYMTYANLVFSYGIESFARRAAEAGADGIILPDVPYEEKEEFESIFNKYNLVWISMIAPTSEERIEKIAREARGFLYIVSSLGVTGVRNNICTDIEKMVGLVRQSTDIPCAVGFGIATPERAAEMAKVSDGAIVGSAIMQELMEAERAGISIAERAGGFAGEMAAAVHRL